MWMSLSRRLLLKGGMSTVVGAGLVGLYGWKWESRHLKVERVEVPIENLPEVFDGFTIAQLSDLHHSKIVPASFLREAVAEANELGADMIALTGDYITKEDEYVEGVAEAVADLRAPAGVFAVLGNHDYHGGGQRAWGNTAIAGHIVESFTRGGIRVLRNQSVEIRRGGQSFTLAGLDDLWSGRMNVSQALEGTDPDRPLVVLSHNPDTKTDLVPRGADLILSGHTHGGQVILPFFGPPIRACRDRSLVRGLYDYGRTRLYINPGIGCLKVNLRINCRPEITLLTLRSA